jgi:mRNA interferase MazF
VGGGGPSAGKRPRPVSRRVPRRGDIYWVDFHPARGSEQAGRRPALVVQNDVGNRHASTTIVVALTTRLRDPEPPHQVLIPAAESGLPRDSMAKCDQILTIARDRLLDRAGVLVPRRMAAVDHALLYSLALSEVLRR